jgi:putative heme-binding domain-containing protein
VPPPENVTVTFQSSVPFQLKSPQKQGDVAASEDGMYRARIQATPKDGQWVPVEIVLQTGSPEPTLQVSFITNEDSRPRAMAVRRFLLPWANASTDGAHSTVATIPPQLKGGDWVSGRASFFSEQIGCAKCHRVRGQGADIGPDLSNLIHRDYDSVLRDIRQPSAAINPDYIAYTIRLKDGRVLNGIPREAGPGRLAVLGDAAAGDGVAASEIEKMSPSAISIMPEGLDKALGPTAMRDLLTFLLTEPLQPAPTNRDEPPPPPRTRAEIEKVLKAGAAAVDAARSPTTQPAKKLNILLAAGPKDHGPGEHDYPTWQRRWATLLGLASDVTVTQANSWPTPQQWSGADVVVMYSANPGWAQDKAPELDTFLKRGGGLVLIHFAVNGRTAVEAWADRIGLAWRDKFSRFRHGPQELIFTDPNHPITRGYDKLKLVDESYWNLVGDPKNAHILAGGVEEGESRPLIWTCEKSQGRVFACIPGHFTWTFDDPLYRILLLRAICWTANEPVDRLSELATIGARVTD